MSFSLAYTEYRPPPDIAPWIACFWQIVGEGASGASLLHRVLPDGCADLVFDMEDARHGAGTPADIVGPMSFANVFELRNAIEIVGVRLRPGAIAAFSGIPAGCLPDSRVPLVELPRPLRISSQTLAECANVQARFELLADICRKRSASLNKPDPVVGYALARWSRTETPLFPTVSVLTRDIGLSERAFERRFVAHVGLTPVHYRRLSRFRAVLRLYSEGVRDWAALAAATGFSDQSHLVRDFGTFAGLTPTAWAAAQAGPAGFLQDGEITTL
jgi:AraC-like DNA-binding protein